jgi:hypothetical protein
LLPRRYVSEEETKNDNDNSPLSVLFGWTKINSSDPHLASIWTPYAAPPLLALFHPVVEIARCGPCGRLHSDRRADFSAIGLVALPVLVEREVEVCRLLPGVVLSEVGGAPTHHAAVPDPPHAGADPTWAKLVRTFGVDRGECMADVFG